MQKGGNDRIRGSENDLYMLCLLNSEQFLNSVFLEIIAFEKNIKIKVNSNRSMKKINCENFGEISSWNAVLHFLFF